MHSKKWHQITIRPTGIKLGQKPDQAAYMIQRNFPQQFIHDILNFDKQPFEK